MKRSVCIALAATLTASAALAQSRTNGSGIRITKDADRAGAYVAPTTTTTTTTPAPAPSLTETTTVVSSAPAFYMSAYANASEANIISHLAAGDTLEVRIAQLAQSRATHQRVRDFATMLVTDHSAHLGKVLHVMSDKKIGTMPLVTDPEGARMLSLYNELSTTPAGESWDARFLRSQVEHHQNEYDALTTARPNVHTEDLRDVVDATLPVLMKHRDTARSLATQLGISVP